MERDYKRCFAACEQCELYENIIKSKTTVNPSYIYELHPKHVELLELYFNPHGRTFQNQKEYLTKIPKVGPADYTSINYYYKHKTT